MSGAARDYQDGLISLGVLIQKIEGILEMLGDRTLKDEIFGEFLALEEVYARTRAGDFDFERDGKHVVDRAAKDLISKLEYYSAHKH